MLQPFSIIFLCPFLILTEFNCYANAKQLSPNCSKTDTFAIGTTIEYNLFKLLSSLRTDALINSAFSNKSFGIGPDEVYGLLMCFADSTLVDCVNCLQDATSNTTQPCSMSATATVQYDSCLISYSSKNILSVADPYYPFCLYNLDISLDQITLKSLMKVFTNLSATTPYVPEMFSTQVVNGTNMSALVQCTKNLSPQECQRCISNAMSNHFSRCSINGTALGMRMMARNCYLRYEPSIINVNSFPVSLLSPPPPPSRPPPPPPTSLAGSKSNSTVTIVVSIVVVSVVSGLVALGFIFWRRKRSLDKDTNDDDDDTMYIQENIETELEYILNPNAEYEVFNFTALKAATDNFSDMNKLGRGGFGPVYKGTLPNRREIAVKRLSGSSAQGITEFKNEVDFLAKLKHKNLVQLLGCSIKNREKLLCYEYLPNGSLDKILFAKDTSQRVNLDWKMRHKIIEGITRGLNYLHEESRLKVIHRDLKVSNILLDKDMNPKISDFGLARFFEEDQTHKDTNIIAGTFGYMAPEYILHGNFSAKSDVYGFGVLLLEILTGQKNSAFVGSNRASNLIKHALLHWNDGTIFELMDPVLEEEFQEEIKICVHIALLCVLENPIDRPTMETVRNMLASPSMIIPNLPPTWSLTQSIDHRTEVDSLTTDTSTLRSEAESFTTITQSSQAESTGTRSTILFIDELGRSRFFPIDITIEALPQPTSDDSKAKLYWHEVQKGKAVRSSLQSATSKESKLTSPSLPGSGSKCKEKVLEVGKSSNRFSCSTPLGYLDEQPPSKKKWEAWPDSGKGGTSGVEAVPPKPNVEDPTNQELPVPVSDPIPVLPAAREVQPMPEVTCHSTRAPMLTNWGGRGGGRGRWGRGRGRGVSQQPIGGLLTSSMEEGQVIIPLHGQEIILNEEQVALVLNEADGSC
ncbi:cysteine-rich receptor-like protein kinase 15 isoform X1 [Carex rostrata]